MNVVKLPDGLKVKGRVTIRGYKAGTKELITEVSSDNLIMTGNQTGFDLLVQYLIGNAVANNAQLGINYLAFGTSSTAAASTDTQLGAETNRATVNTVQDVSYNEAVLQAFFPDSTVTNGTYTEVGSFVNGTATANSGQLFNHSILTTSYVKASGQDTTVQVTITFST